MAEIATTRKLLQTRYGSWVAVEMMPDTARVAAMAPTEAAKTVVAAGGATMGAETLETVAVTEEMTGAKCPIGTMKSPSSPVRRIAV